MVTSSAGLGANARPGQEATLGDSGLADDGMPDALAPDAWYQQAQSARYGRTSLASPTSAMERRTNTVSLILRFRHRSASHSRQNERALGPHPWRALGG
jgi:hypothetical protein